MASEPDLDRCYGALIGGFIGDSAGLVREFRDVATEKEIDHAITLPGGGYHKAGASQISDDSELA